MSKFRNEIVGLNSKGWKTCFAFWKSMSNMLPKAFSFSRMEMMSKRIPDSYTAAHTFTDQLQTTCELRDV